jgi:hypothetical protein
MAKKIVTPFTEPLKTAEISNSFSNLPRFKNSTTDVADFIRDEDFHLFGRKQPFDTLSTSVENATKFVEFAIKVLGVEPENLVVMAS